MLLGTAALAAGLLVSRSASAWQCNRVRDNNNQPKGASLYWPTRTIPYAFNEAGTYQLDRDVAFNTIREAFNTWQSSSLRTSEPAGCVAQLADPNATATDVAFAEQALTDQNFVGYSVLNPNSNRNIIIFRDQAWPYPLGTLGGDPAENADFMSMTTVTFNKLSGQILDADIEFNSYGYRFTVDDSNVIYDLHNVASHEVGHFLGFGHSLDANATMYKTANFGETFKRLLSCDDAVGLWFRFPNGASTMACPAGVLNDQCGQCLPSSPLTLSPNPQIRRLHDGAGGCQCQSAEPGQAAALCAAALWLRRRRRSRAA